MLRRNFSSSSSCLLCSAFPQHLQQQQHQHQQEKKHKQPIKDTRFKKYNPSDPRTKRLAVLVDAESMSVETFFQKVQPAIRTHLPSSHYVTLLNRIFAHSLRPDWQQVVLNRAEDFDFMRVERFITMQMQVVADAGHISQRRLQNKVNGIVVCCEEPLSKIYIDQLSKREVFTFVDKFIITDSGELAHKVTLEN